MRCVELTLYAISMLVPTGPRTSLRNVCVESIRDLRAASTSAGRSSRLSSSKETGGRLLELVYASRRLALARISSASWVNEGIVITVQTGQYVPEV